MILSWSVSSFNYFLIGFQMKYIKGNIFNNTMFSSTSEIIAYIVSLILLVKIGPKYSYILSYAFSFIGALLYIVLGSRYEAAIPVMIFATKFGISSAFNINFLVNAYLFPSIYNATAYGICNLFAKLATIFAPIVAEVEGNIPMIIFTSLSGCACLASFFLITNLPKVK